MPGQSILRLPDRVVLPAEETKRAQSLPAPHRQRAEVHISKAYAAKLSCQLRLFKIGSEIPTKFNNNNEGKKQNKKNILREVRGSLSRFQFFRQFMKCSSKLIFVYLYFFVDILLKN